jgi:hypothetical protein
MWCWFAAPLLLSFECWEAAIKGHIRRRGDAWELRIYVGVDAGRGNNAQRVLALRSRSRPSCGRDSRRPAPHSRDSGRARLENVSADRMPHF